MGWGIGNLGGGAGGLNFKIVGGTTQPTTPSENTIWVNTAEQITSWEFSATEPTAIDGMVWIATGTSSTVSFNALKKNSVMVYPLTAKQYVSGAWVAKSAKIYQGGEWGDLRAFLFNCGKVNTELTGGIYGEIATDAIAFSGTINAGANKTYTSESAIDLTNYNSIKARFKSPGTVTSVFLRLLVMNKSSDGDSVTTSNLVANVSSDSPFNDEERVVSLDISGLSGSYFVGYAWGVLSSASGARNVSGSIYEWWLE